MFKKICGSLVVVLGLGLSSVTMAQVCGDGGQFWSTDPWTGANSAVCVGGSQGNRAYGTNIYDGVGPPAVDNGGTARNNGNSGNATGNWGTVKKIIDKWGAVAFDASRSSYGYSVHMGSKLDAENTALSDCGGQSCQIMATYKNSCAALAGGYKPTGGTYAIYKWNLNNVKKAENLALSACSKKAKNCQILMSECSLP